MQQNPEIPKPRQLPCEAIYRKGGFIGRVRIEAIRATESGTAVDMVLLETLANWVCVPIALEDLKPVVGQRWTLTNNYRFRGSNDHMMSTMWLWNIDFRENILEGATKFSRTLICDLRSNKRFCAILDKIEEIKSEYSKIFPINPPEPPTEPIRAKKVTDPEITKKFDFDIFEEDGKIFRYVKGYRKTMHLF